jgi:hypothetical protein
MKAWTPMIQSSIRMYPTSFSRSWCGTRAPRKPLPILRNVKHNTPDLISVFVVTLRRVCLIPSSGWIHGCTPISYVLEIFSVLTYRSTNAIILVFLTVHLLPKMTTSVLLRLVSPLL